MKRYEAVFNKDENVGVFGISLVKHPAMQGEFLTFSEQKIQFAEVDNEKRILLGLVLEPNKDILRIDHGTGDRYSITFSEDTIESLAHNFQRQGFQNISTIEHSGKVVEGITFAETWIVEDLKHEKSVKYGFNYPVGSWLVKMKVDSDEVWNEYVKTGVVKGFSIDAFVELKEINTNIEMSTEKKNIKDHWEALGKLLSFNTVKETVEDTETTETVEDVSEETQEVETETEVSDIALNDEFMEMLSKVMVNFKSEIVAEIEKSKPAKIELSEDKVITDLKTELSEVKKELLEFSKRPVVKAVKSTPSQVDYNSLSNLEKVLYNEQNK